MNQRKRILVLVCALLAAAFHSVLPTSAQSSDLISTQGTAILLQNQPVNESEAAILEDSVNNPISGEAQILEILAGLSELERSNLPREEGWLHRYDTVNGKPGRYEFIAHLPGGVEACDLQLWLLNEGENLHPMRLGDLRNQVMDEGDFVDLDKNGGVIRSERGSIQCDLITGYSSVGTSMSPHFLSGLLPGFQQDFFLLRSTGLGSGGISAWYIEEDGVHYFVLQKYSDNLNGTLMSLGDSGGEVNLKTKKEQFFIDTETGRLIRSISEYITMDGETIRRDIEHHLVFYQTLPPHLWEALQMIEGKKQQHD